MTPHDATELLARWPANGAETLADQATVARLTARYGLVVDPGVTRKQLRSWLSRRAMEMSVPWKYQEFFRPNHNIRQDALKLQPGIMLPIALKGLQTTGYVESVRRTTHSGKPYYVRLTMTVSTEHIPVIVENETKCTCLFCGTQPRGDERSCRGCGAPLPDC